MCEKIMAVGESLVTNGDPQKAQQIKRQLRSLQEKWNKLDELADRRGTLLNDALESHQYYADANEAESWMKEKMPLAGSQDFGTDEASAKVRHMTLFVVLFYCPFSHERGTNLSVS